MNRSRTYLCAVLVLAAPFGFSAKYGHCCEKDQAAEQEPEYQREDLTVKVGDRQFVATILSPPKGKLAKQPALLVTLGADRDSTLFTNPFSQIPSAFLKHGHRTASFDLPCHGQRIDRFGPGISGLRASFVAGVDPFKMCVEDGQAVITECIKRGWATPGRIAAEGASRGGYMALRLLAADDRISVGAGLAPVTDWRELSEFASVRDREDVAGLQLTRFAAKMAEKHVHLAIGKHDDRVGTAACQELYRVLKQARVAENHCDSWLEFKLTDDPGHSITSDYENAIAFLLTCSNAKGVTCILPGSQHVHLVHRSASRCCKNCREIQSVPQAIAVTTQ